MKFLMLFLIMWSDFQPVLEVIVLITSVITISIYMSIVFTHNPVGYFVFLTYIGGVGILFSFLITAVMWYSDYSSKLKTYKSLILFILVISLISLVFLNKPMEVMMNYWTESFNYSSDFMDWFMNSASAGSIYAIMFLIILLFLLLFLTHFMCRSISRHRVA
uniref:NADH dehydrogenase subunit 6 n=1 Tax=Trichodectes canis TaxID=209909 RepID=A0A386B2K5_9NEOP|nr:NADH dehydrogenase subunit 6 [Trichodectes canis]